MPHSKASLTVFPGGRRVLEPPVEFTAGSLERQIWVETAQSVPDGHFAPEDAGLLAAYCRALALERRASDELAASAVTGSMPSPWLAVYTTATRAISTYAVRLRIGPRARSHNVRRSNKPVREPSAYELMDSPAAANPPERGTW
jgi:phage terminase small subunit